MRISSDAMTSVYDPHVASWLAQQSEQSLPQQSLPVASQASLPVASQDKASASQDGMPQDDAVASLASPEMQACATILHALVKRKDARWFREPVPTDRYRGYSLVVSSPMDYGTIQSKLEGGAYADAAAFAADVRLVAANAIAYSPKADDECNLAARHNLAAFETAFVKAHLATDGGAAATAATAAIELRVRQSRKRKPDVARLDQE